MQTFGRVLSIFLTFLLCVSGGVIGAPSSYEPPENRIIGGTPASTGQFPFQVGLRLKFENIARLGTCGGVLIADDFVLTAGHCVAIDDIEHIEVHLGTLVLTSEDEERLVVVVPKENFIIHTWYDISTISNDIALLRLPQKVSISDAIKPIDLPTYNDVYRLNLEDKNVTASGWGRYSDDSPNASTVLQYAQVRVIHQQICKHYYQNLRSSMICTSTGRGQGTCHGDSGGPLIYRDNVKDRTILIGLTSFGNGRSCVGESWPSVFTRVSSFLEWIEHNSGIPIKEN